ncbi:MAG: TraR/DksA family transcriptional regulator [Verrucomicrobiales bacterium]|nr:TraR/DksA family transcriptional regulator [Verrucomicrobiota bacterium JB025]
MKSTQLATIRRKLIAERERIVTEWQNHGGHAGSADEWDTRDIEERAIQITSDTIERRIADDDLNLLRKVNFAIERLDQGSYTQCANCGNEIPIERLMAKPSVSLCLSCQKQKDSGALQHL